MIEIYISGKKVNLKNSQLNKIQDYFYYVIMEARSMPAFGVAIDNLVKKDFRRGVWMSIKFKDTQIVNEMPFDELLVNIHKGWSGFNLIRGNKGIYEGRCFYLDTDSNLDMIHRYILLTNRKNRKNGVEDFDDVRLATLLENGISKILSYK